HSHPPASHDPYTLSLHDALPICILELIAIDNFAEDTFRWNRLTVGRHHQCDLALRHDRNGRFDNSVLPPEESEMQSWRQRICLVDRKSTRLNSSHDQTSYAVFRL